MKGKKKLGWGREVGFIHITNTCKIYIGKIILFIHKNMECAETKSLIVKEAI